MSNFEASEHSYGAHNARKARRPRKHRAESSAIAADRKRIREIKRKIAIALNLGLATGGVSALIQAAARKAGPRKLVHELHEAEVKLHYDIAKAKERAGGRKALPMSVIRRTHKLKTAEEAGAEAVAEDKDSTGSVAAANDAAAADVAPADLATDSSSSSTDDDDKSSVGITASADAGSGASTGMLVVGGIVVAALVYKSMKKKEIAR